MTASFYEANHFVNQWYVLFVKTIGGGGINDTFRRYLAIVSEVRYGFA